MDDVRHDAVNHQGETRENPFTCIDADYCGVEFDEREFTSRTVIPIACKCGSQWCPGCRVAHAVMWRERLRPIVRDWERISMITLTLDRKRFGGAREAYMELQKKRAVSELVRWMVADKVLEDGRFFYAIEFHKNGGWVHWHMAVVPRADWIGRMNDRSKWGGRMYLAEKWKHGYAFESSSKASSPEHAMNYLTKYLAKQDVEAPEWVLSWEGNFRKFNASRCISKLWTKGRKKKQGKGRRRKRRSIGERIEHCREETKLIERVDTYSSAEAEGEVSKSSRYSFIGKHSVTEEEIKEHPKYEIALKQLRRDGHIGRTVFELPFEMWDDFTHPIEVEAERPPASPSSTGTPKEGMS